MDSVRPTSRVPIVYAFPCRWDSTPARQRYLMEAISEHVPVVFLNYPNLTGRLFEAPRPRAEQVTPNLTVVHDAFGMRSARFGRHMRPFAASIDAAWLHRLLASRGINEYVYWLAAVMPELLLGMRTDRLVYDCIDPTFDNDHAEFDRREFAIARKSKLTFCTAHSLLERIQTVQPAANLLPNACSPDEYHASQLQGIALPKALVGRPKPIVGYMGTFDARVDTDLLIAAARALPDCTFALVGRTNPGQESRVSGLLNLPNVVMPGSVSVEDGRAYTAAFDVGLVPFCPGPVSDAINPVKMWMYLAAGKPVVSTDMRECKQLAPHVMVGRGVSGFVDAIRSALSSENLARAGERVAVAMQNRWADRAVDAVAVLEHAGLLTPSKKEWPRSRFSARAITPSRDPSFGAGQHELLEQHSGGGTPA